MANIEWRCPYKVYYRFQEHLSLLQGMDPNSDDAKAIIQEIRGLPGYPNDYDEDRDEVVVVPYKELL